MFRPAILTLTTAAALAVTTAFAGGHEGPHAGAIKARKGVMNLYAFQLGQLGAMAKGAVDYDAGQAQAAADALVYLAGMGSPAMWPEGSDSFSVDGTRAAPEIWENMGDVGAKAGAMVEAAAALQAAAGQGLDALRPAMGGVGQACKGCHMAYRSPAN